MKQEDVFLAEVSYPAIGLGIELGFAAIYDLPILCMYQKGLQISGSLKHVAKDFLEYSYSTELISGIERFVDQL